MKIEIEVTARRKSQWAQDRSDNSGRGRMVTWLKNKKDADEEIERYRV